MSQSALVNKLLQVFPVRFMSYGTHYMSVVLTKELNVINLYHNISAVKQSHELGLFTGNSYSNIITRCHLHQIEFLKETIFLLKTVLKHFVYPTRNTMLRSRTAILCAVFFRIIICLTTFALRTNPFDVIALLLYF